MHGFSSTGKRNAMILFAATVCWLSLQSHLIEIPLSILVMIACDSANADVLRIARSPAEWVSVQLANQALEKKKAREHKTREAVHYWYSTFGECTILILWQIDRNDPCYTERCRPAGKAEHGLDGENKYEGSRRDEKRPVLRHSRLALVVSQGAATGDNREEEQEGQEQVCDMGSASGSGGCGLSVAISEASTVTQ